MKFKLSKLFLLLFLVGYTIGVVFAANTEYKEREIPLACSPDSNITLKYPCVIFSIDRENSRYADNKRYMSQLRYTVTLVTRNAVDPLITKLMDNFNYLSLDRTYRTSGLYHYIFVLYF